MAARFELTSTYGYGSELKGTWQGSQEKLPLPYPLAPLPPPTPLRFPLVHLVRSCARGRVVR
jgi:hypothetical protein